MIDTLIIALGSIFSWPNILYPIAGTLIAMVVSFLPGIGMSSIAPLFILLTLSWSPIEVLLLFGALVGGATYMGSVTGILFNIPGGAPSAAILLDGFPLAQRGYPLRALAAAATASAIGSLIGVLALVLMLPMIKPYILEFGPVERSIIILWGLLCVILISDKSFTQACLMVILGLFLGLVGLDPITASPRMTFGFQELSDGIDPIVFLLGFLTFYEGITWVRRQFDGKQNSHTSASDDSVISGILEVFKHKWLALQSSCLGMLVGIIPGIGGTIASFVAYTFASSKYRHSEDVSFGQGDIRGVIAPEAAVDAKDGGSLFPAILLGLPGSEAGIALISVFAIHGLVPGPLMLGEQLPLTMVLVMSLLLSNLLTSLIGLGFCKKFIALKNLKIQYFFSPLLLLVVFLIYDLKASDVDIGLMLLIAFFAFLIDKLSLPKIPFIVAFILGKTLESNVMVSVQILESNLSIFFRKNFLMGLVLFCVLSLLILIFRRTHSAQHEQNLSHGFSLTLCVLLMMISTMMLINQDLSFYANLIAITLLVITPLYFFQIYQLSGVLSKNVEWMSLFKKSGSAKNIGLQLVELIFILSFLGYSYFLI